MWSLNMLMNLNTLAVISNDERDDKDKGY